MIYWVTNPFTEMNIALAVFIPWTISKYKTYSETNNINDVFTYEVSLITSLMLAIGIFGQVYYGISNNVVNNLSATYAAIITLSFALPSAFVNLLLYGKNLADNIGENVNSLKTCLWEK